MPMDFREVKTRVLGCTSLITVGTAVTAFFGSDASLATAVTAALASVAGSILASEIHGKYSNALDASGNVLHNGDLQKAAGSSIAMVLDNLAGTLVGVDRRAIRKVARRAVAAWEEYEVSPADSLVGITEAELPAYFSTTTQEFPHLRVLKNEDAWRPLLDETVRRFWFGRPSGAALDAAARALHEKFHLALREVLAQDGTTGRKAYKKLLLLLQGEIRAKLTDLGIRLDDVGHQVGEMMSRP